MAIKMRYRVTRVEESVAVPGSPTRGILVNAVPVTETQEAAVAPPAPHPAAIPAVPAATGQYQWFFSDPEAADFFSVGREYELTFAKK